ANVHQAVVKLGQGAGRALDSVASRIVTPAAVVVPWAARIIGANGIVRLGSERIGRGRTVVGRPGSPESTSGVGGARVTCTRVVSGASASADRNRCADRSSAILSTCESRSAHRRQRATDPCFGLFDR